MELRTLKSAEHKVKQRWVSGLNIFSLLVYTSGFEMNTFRSYGEEISPPYFRVSHIRNAVKVASLFLNCPSMTQLQGASLSLQANILLFFSNEKGSKKIWPLLLS